VVPKWDSPHWKHSAWDYFKTEMAQVLDHFIQKKYTVNFLPFCINYKLNDSYAAGELINRMNEIEGNPFITKPLDVKSVINTISKYRVVITQRYHGTVLAEMAQTPCLTIHHHDKLKNSEGSRISYYSSSKNSLIEELNNILLGKIRPVLPIDRNIFTRLNEKVEHEICRSQK
jgi:exopolysaccharide biosynthesis predicted pyruvyltransferase EpsI